MERYRHVDAVEISEIESWNRDDDFPKETITIDEIDGKKIGIYTTNVVSAYEYYKKQKDYLYSGDYYIELASIEVLVSDNEWSKLKNKEILEYNDYCSFLTKNAIKVIAWSYSYERRSDSYTSVIDSILMEQSEYFNMRAVCEKAGISYSTFRGYKNNGQSFSSKKKYDLLKCMYEIGQRSWNNEFDIIYNALNNKK